MFQNQKLPLLLTRALWSLLTEWQHAMNHPDGQKTFGKHKVDLYSPKLKEVLQFHGCQFHCHLPPDCLINKGKSLKDLNPLKTTFEALREKDESVKKDLLQNYSDEVKTYNVQFGCLWKEEQRGFDYQFATIVDDIALYDRPSHRLIPRACVRGVFWKCTISGGKSHFSQMKSSNMRMLILFIHSVQ